MSDKFYKGTNHSVIVNGESIVRVARNGNQTEPVFDSLFHLNDSKGTCGASVATQAIDQSSVSSGNCTSRRRRRMVPIHVKVS